MSLRDDVRAYYWHHFDQLPTSYRFHFANRLAIWGNDPRANQELQKLKQTMAPSPLTLEKLQEQISHKVNSPLRRAMPVYELRLPYLTRYPKLYGWHQALFYVRHLDVVYGIDARQALLQTIDSKDMQQLARTLWEDHAALHTLSTIAVNFLYMYQRYIAQQPEDIAIDTLYTLGNSYNLDDPEELRLLLYLYTHCIIAASNFYANPLPQQHVPVYRSMLEFLDHIISSHYDHINLDTKLEFLVCCRIASYESGLEARITEECAQSVSPNGTFLVDTLNDFALRHVKRTFTESEHRNVLFILSGSPFLR